MWFALWLLDGLTDQERAAVLELMNSAEYAELPPAQI